MKKIFTWLKEHPLIVALIVGVVVLLLLLRGNSHPSTGSVAYTGTGQVDTAASASMAQASLAAGVQTHQVDAALQATENTNATELAKASLAADVARYTADLGAQTTALGIGAQRDIQLGGLAAQVQLADISQETTREQIGASVEIAKANANTYESITNAQATTQQRALDDAAMVQLAPYHLADTIYSTLGSSGLTDVINHATGTKDAVLNLPGFSAMRATNFAPAGATPNPNGTAGAVASIFSSLTKAVAML